MKLKKSCHFQKNQLSTSHPCSISFNQRFLSDRVHTFHFYFCGKVYPQGVWWSDDVMLVSQLHQKCITVGPWISRCLLLCCCTLTFQNLHFKLYDILKHKKFSIGFLDELGNFKQKKIYISKCRFFYILQQRTLCPSSHTLVLSEISEVISLHASMVLASLTIFKKSIPNRYLQKQREEWRNRVEEHKWHAYHSSTQKLCYLNLYQKNYTCVIEGMIIKD